MTAMKSLFLGFCAAILGGCASLPDTASAPTVVATLDRQNGVAFVDPNYTAQVAKLWRVENPSASQWLVSRPNSKPMLVNVVRKPLSNASADVADAVILGCTCSGNNPPGTDDTGCMRSANVGGSQQVKQTVGYSFCKSSKNSADVCDSTRVQVGDWIYYSDPNCTTETGRVPFTRSVCLP